jgi:acetyl-CoA acetyltransferase
MAPVSAVEKLLRKTGWEREAVDLYEIMKRFQSRRSLIEQLRLNQIG